MEDPRNNPSGLISWDKNRAAGLSKLLSDILKIHRIKDLYQKYAEKPEEDFIDAILENLHIEIDLFEDEIRGIPKEGPFILVANHPFGGIDALLMLKAVGRVRPDLRILSNFLLSSIDALNQRFIPTHVFDHDVSPSDDKGLREARKHLQSGKPLGIFPAGQVSVYNLKSKSIKDRRWNQKVMDFIKEQNIPVVPFFIAGRNALLFNLLNIVSPVIRTGRLQPEFVKSQDRTVTLRIGKPISEKEQEEFSNRFEYGRYLRIRTYLLAQPIYVKPFFRPKLFSKKSRDIVPPRDQKVIKNEIDNLIAEGFLLYEIKQYRVVWTTSDRASGVLYEIGRLREITFREVGEGTGKNIDLDEYDLYYRHLFIWDAEEERIVGAYRLGMGKEIMERFGKRGFYLNSLFRLKKGFHSVLEESIELGRSFIVKEYQLKPLSLFMLWKGILYYILKNPDYRYLIGPVSISGEFSEFSKSLIIKHIKENYFDHHLASLVSPRKEFIPEVDFNDPDLKLVDRYTREDLKRLDKVIEDIELGGFRLPALLKKYLSQNAKIIGFNVDPQFNNALDGLLVLDLFDVPFETLEGLAKELEDKEVLESIRIRKQE
jgi:putative hemolysin